MTVNIALFDDLDAVAADAAGALDRRGSRACSTGSTGSGCFATHCPPPGQLAVWRARDGDTTAWLFLAVEGKKASAYARLV